VCPIDLFTGDFIHPLIAHRSKIAAVEQMQGKRIVLGGRKHIDWNIYESEGYRSAPE
jgi:hypothetical protein